MIALRMASIGLALILSAGCSDSKAPASGAEAGAPGGSVAAAEKPAAEAAAAPKAVQKTVDADGLNRGDRAVNFTGKIVYGGEGSLTLEDYVGTYPKTQKDGVIVAFGASWCGYCKLSLDTLEALSHEHENLQIIYVGTDEDEAGWSKEIAIFEQKKLNFPLIRVDDTNALMQTYFGNKRNVPRFYLIDHSGVVRIKDQGFSKKKMGQLLPKQVRYLLGLAK